MRLAFNRDGNGNCSLAVLSNFGGPHMHGYSGTLMSTVGEEGNTHYPRECFNDDGSFNWDKYDTDNYEAAYHYEDIADFKAQCRELVKNFDNGGQGIRPTLATMALVYASTSSLQEDAERILRELGFTASPTYSSTKYKGLSKITVWTISAPEFIRAIK